MTSDLARLSRRTSSCVSMGCSCTRTSCFSNFTQALSTSNDWCSQRGPDRCLSRSYSLGRFLPRDGRTGFPLRTIRPVRVLTYIERLSDCFGFFDVRITCQCGARREIDARELAQLVGWLSLAEAQQRVRCSKCGKKGAAEVVALAQPRPRGIPKNPH